MKFLAFQPFISLWLSDSSDLHAGETQRYFFMRNRLNVQVFIDLSASEVHLSEEIPKESKAWCLA